MRRLRLRYPGTCHGCGTALAAGTSAWWEPATRRVTCVGCRETAAEVAPASAVLDNAAGGSAQAEYDRRRAARERRIRERHPRLGGVLLAVTDEPQHQRAWRSGAKGERIVADRLRALEDRGIQAIHDRRVPGSTANIDHIAVSPQGVVVIDAKRWSGDVEVRDVSGWLSPRDERLYVGGRDRTRYVAKMAQQVALVGSVLDGTPHADVTVRGILALSGTELPLLRSRPYELDGVRICTADMLRRELTRHHDVAGALGPTTVQAITSTLAERLPPAT